MIRGIEDKVAIVTGAGTGVGLASARLLIARGARVMAADSDEARLTDAFGETDPQSVTCFAADMGERLSATNLLTATLNAYDRVDILINAHRLIKPSDPFGGDEEILDEMLRENMMTGLRLTRLVARQMQKQAEEDSTPEDEAGAIVSISTLATQWIQPQFLAYSVAAAALDQATRALARALAPKRIRVNGVRFASVMSEQMRGALKEHEGGNLRAKVLGATPMGRIGTAAEVANAVVFLASPDAGFITGQFLSVDGGRSLSDAVPAAIE